MDEFPPFYLYEALQLSPGADVDTIQRVFRHLAKRYHPDNAESGDAVRFRQVMDAYDVLSDPARRARYDVAYEQERETRWRIFDQETATSDLVSDRRIRHAIMALLYTARRNDPDRPGMGMLDLERFLGCPEQHMKFHVWYLKENGWLQYLENGLLAITAQGVDRVMELGGPLRGPVQLLDSGEGHRMAQ